MVKNTILFAGNSLTYGSGNQWGIPLPILVSREARNDGIELVPLMVAYPGWTSLDLYRALCGFHGEAREAVVYIGTNDAKEHVPVDIFITTLRAIENVIKHNVKALRVFFCVPQLLDGFGSQGYDKTTNFFIEEYREAIMENFELVIDIPKVKRPDGVHPDLSGYSEIAKAIWRAIGGNRLYG